MQAHPMANVPTVLQIIPSLKAGGAEMDTLTVTRALVRAGARSLIATEGGRMSEEFRQAGGEIIDFPAATKNPIRILANVIPLKRIAQLRKIDLIHARSRAPAWTALWASRSLKLPIVTTCHGSHYNKGRLKNAYSRVMGRGDRVIAVSRYSGDLVRGQYGTPPARLRTIYRGIDFGRFNFAAIAPARLERLRNLWGVKDGHRLALQAGRLTRLKGQGTVIEAAAKLLSQGRLGDTLIVLAGDADGRENYRRELELAITAAGLKNHIRLVGHCDDMPAAFALARVSLIASTRAETFGLVSVEAQAMGCPVIATDLGANPETIIAAPDERFTGWLFKAGDAGALSDLLVTALDLSSQERQAIGARARDHALAHFSQEAMQRGTLAVYDELLGTALVEKFNYACSVG